MFFIFKNFCSSPKIISIFWILFFLFQLLIYSNILISTVHPITLRLLSNNVVVILVPFFIVILCNRTGDATLVFFSKIKSFLFFENLFLILRGRHATTMIQKQWHKFYFTKIETNEKIFQFSEQKMVFSLNGMVYNIALK